MAYSIEVVGATVKSGTIGLGLGLLVLTIGMVFFGLADSDGVVYLTLLPLLTGGLGLLIGFSRAKRIHQEQ